MTRKDCIFETGIRKKLKKKKKNDKMKAAWWFLWSEKPFLLRC